MKNFELLSDEEIVNQDLYLNDGYAEDVKLNRVWTTSEIYQYSNQNLLAECQYYFPFPSYRRFYKWFL
jgi:hypothetical protein